MITNADSSRVIPVLSNRNLLLCAGLLLCGLWAGLAIWSDQPTLVPVYGLLGIQFVAWLIVLGVWWAMRKETAGFSVVMVLVFAFLMRLPSFYAYPIYEDDFFRFLWDGFNFVTDGSPYNGAPEIYFDNPEYKEPTLEVLYSVNYPEVPTIYAPVCQLFFALGYLIAPLKLWSLRFIMLAVEMLILWRFSKVASVRQLLLFAWCPLLIYESMFQVHPDFLAASFLLLAYFSRKQEGSIWTGICCALAIGIKITVLPALAFLLWPLKKRDILAFMLTGLVMYLPFLMQGSRADFDGLLVFVREWEFNASLYSIAVHWYPREIVKFMMLGGFASVFFYLWFSWQRRGAMQSEIPYILVMVYGVFFLCSPVVNPWYLLLMLPFVCLAPKPWAIVAMMIVSVSNNLYG